MKPLEIGRVVKPHGFRGELKIRLHWTHSDALTRASAVDLVSGNERRQHRIERVRGGSGGPLLKLAGIDDREAAEACRGAALCVAREELEALDPGEFYLADLVGFEVVAPDGSVGHVTSVNTHPTVDSLVIESPDGKRLEQPLSDAWVENVDVSARSIRLVSRDGLID